MTNTSSQSSQDSLLIVAPTPVPPAPAIGFVIVAISVTVVASWFGYKKYRTHQRSRLLKRQVAMLEAMWRISSTK